MDLTIFISVGLQRSKTKKYLKNNKRYNINFIETGLKQEPQEESEK